MKKRILSSLILCCVVCFVSADPIGPAKALKIASSYLQEEVPMARVTPLRRGTTRSISEADSVAPL